MLQAVFVGTEDGPHRADLLQGIVDPLDIHADVGDVLVGAGIPIGVFAPQGDVHAFQVEGASTQVVDDDVDVLGFVGTGLDVQVAVDGDEGLGQDAWYERCASAGRNRRNHRDRRDEG